MSTETDDNQIATQTPEDGDRFETLIEAAIDVYNSVQALWTAQAVVFCTDEAPESLLANLAAHGLDDEQIADLFAALSRYADPRKAQANQSQPAPQIINAAGINYSDGEWAALGWKPVHIDGASKIMRRDTPTGPQFATTNRWIGGKVPHGRRFTSKKG